MSSWFKLIDLIKNFSFSTGKDMPVWMLEPSSKYSVKSFL